MIVSVGTMLSWIACAGNHVSAQTVVQPIVRSARNTQATTGPPTSTLPALHGVQHDGEAAGQRMAVGSPFHLSDVEREFTNQVLVMWENKSNQIATYYCDFERWEYDPVFGPGENIPLTKSRGQLTYAKPDKGSFKIQEIHRWIQADSQQAGEHVLQKNEVGEHWVCDGKAIFEYKHAKKQLVVQPLPEQMRGKSIVDGPLPFLFGAEAEKLKQRYWIKCRSSDAATILLEAYPRRQADAANYHHVDVMLDRKSMHPTAIRVHMPNNRNQAVYIFSKPTINGKMDKLFGAFFQVPRTPFGWTRVVQPLPEQGPRPQAALPAGETKQR
jgi:TIGR03009 family protein